MVCSRITVNITVREKFACTFATSLREAKGRFSELLQPSLLAKNGIIGVHVSSGEYDKALECFYCMQQKGVIPDQITVFNLLKACISVQSIIWARLIHAEVLRRRLETTPSFGNMLVHMYVKCNNIDDAWKVFKRLPCPDIISWGTIVSGCAIHQHNIQALVLFDEMQEKGILPNTVVFLGILKACMNLESLVMVMQSHHQIVRTGIASNVVLVSTLIDMYSKSGCLGEAQYLFDKLPEKNVVSWGSIITGYVQHGHGVSALRLYEQMKQEGLKPDKGGPSAVCRACAKVKASARGSLVHIQVMFCKFRSDIVVGNSLIDMHAKCGNLETMLRVFHEMETKNAVSWGAVIAGYVQHNFCEVALELYTRMIQGGLKPDLLTFSCLVKACGIMGTLQEGKLLHGHIVRRGYGDDLITGNALLDMYSKCGSLEDAEILFDRLQYSDRVSWGAIIAGSVQHGKSHNALELFSKMAKKGIEPDKITFLSILKACGSIVAIQEGRLIHDQIIRKGLKSDVIVGNALIDMYIKCGSLEEARAVFNKLDKRVVVSWGVMISGYAQFERITCALKLLCEMHSENIEADNVTYLCILSACSKMGALKQGRLMHDQIIVNGINMDLVVTNAIIDMYAKCGSLGEAHKVFDSLPDRNVVSWDTMLTAYIYHDNARSALDLWKKMCKDGIKPIRVSFICALKACCIAEAMKEGKLLHYQIMQSGFDKSISVSNSLVDMYAKCGSLEDADHIFRQSPNQDVVSWSAIISGHARVGNYNKARQCLEVLQVQGLKPNSEIFLGVLGACRQAGLVEEARHWFLLMTEKHGISPCIEHYSCIIDLLGNSGLLKEAINFMEAMPYEPDAIVWTSLLTSSGLYGSVELGNYCFEKLVELNQDDASVYALMAKIYTDLDMIQDADKVRAMQIRAITEKVKPGLPWIEDIEVHEVIVERSTWYNEKEVCQKVNRLSHLIRGGHVPQIDWISEPEDLIYHGKKLYEDHHNHDASNIITL